MAPPFIPANARRRRGKPRRRRVSIIGAVLLVALAIAAQRRGYLAAGSSSAPPAPESRGATAANRAPTPAAGSSSIADAFRQRQSDTWVEATGTVTTLLPDDADGERHQKFLVRISGAAGLTVLIAHNVDAAPRVPAREGDAIRFRGEYEWTDKGGTVHFTHAPKFDRKAPGGWIEHAGKRYE